MRAIRDAESRMRFLGYRELRQVGILVVSAEIAGVAVPGTCRRSASSIRANLRRSISIRSRDWGAGGGRGTLYGAAAGAVLVNARRCISPCAARGVAIRAGALFGRDALSPRGRSAVLMLAAQGRLTERFAKRAKCSISREVTVSFDGFKALN